MLFNSYAFWVFLGTVLVLCRLLPFRAQNGVLLIASYFFYGCWNWRFMYLMLFSTAFAYLAGLAMDRSTSRASRKSILVSSLVLNLAVLGTFKYYGFFAGELVRLLTALGLPVGLSPITVIVPLGISFYTFQTMSYLIDVYRRTITPSRDPVAFALYVSFFPKLAAGPIERAGPMLSQIDAPRPRNPNAFGDGMHEVLVGLFKKVVIADNLAPVVGLIFSSPSLTGPEVIVGAYAFAFQIYGDFSGYSSIARGIAIWMGFELVENFRMPYLASTPGEFWSRWHISLSTWLRDYLFLPLSSYFSRRLDGVRLLGQRDDLWIYAAATLCTMLLAGLWHGANWTFVLWGAFQGVLLVSYRLFGLERRRRRMNAVGVWVSRIVMFHLVCLGWLLFRAETLAQAAGMAWKATADFTMTATATSGMGMIAFFAGPLMLYELWLNSRSAPGVVPTIRPGLQACVYSYCALMLWFFPPLARHEFIYFRF